MSSTKFCFRCEQELPKDNFYKSNARCKLCVSAIKKEQKQQLLDILNENPDASMFCTECKTDRPLKLFKSITQDTCKECISKKTVKRSFLNLYEKYMTPEDFKMYNDYLEDHKKLVDVKKAASEQIRKHTREFSSVKQKIRYRIKERVMENLV